MAILFPTSVSEEFFSHLVAQARQYELTVPDICDIVRWAAASGEQLKWGADQKVVDLASTGGPGSLSTLLVPLMLRSKGCLVAKLGVPGRPAGGVDVLGAIPGYRVDLSTAEVRNIVSTTGYAHFLAGKVFAPLDAELFEYRRTKNSLALPALVIASILAKKVAVGVTTVGLDVRVGGFGNFGRTMSEAIENSKLFCAVAEQLGLTALAFVYESSSPEIPGIGRGESLSVLNELLTGTATPWAERHMQRCATMAALLAGHGRQSTGFDWHELLGPFRDNLRAQGTSLDAFHERVGTVQRLSTFELKAKHDGHLKVHLAGIRNAIVLEQQEAPVEPQVHFNDPAGISLHRYPGSAVLGGTTLGRVRIELSSPKSQRFLQAIDENVLVESSGQPAEQAQASPMEVIRA